MKITKVFWITLVFILFLSFVAYLSVNLFSFGGGTKWGFPITFYSYGGECVRATIDELAGGCNSFSLINLIIDLATLLIIPLLIDYFFQKIREK